MEVFDQISRRAGKVIVEYGLIHPGDKILVAVSGGKDSLTLLNVLLHRQSIAPIDFELIAIHIDMGMPGPDKDKLVMYFDELGVRYHIESSFIFTTMDGGLHPDVNCFWCSWNRRKLLFKVAERLGANKIALGHHLDDIVETILLNQFFKGEISSMCPKQGMFDGKMTLIRPLALEYERKIIEFAEVSNIISFESCRCSKANQSQREAIKKILSGLEVVNPGIKMNIFNSLSKILTEYLPQKVNDFCI